MSQWSQAQRQTDHQQRVADQLVGARNAVSQQASGAMPGVQLLARRQSFGVRLHDVCDQAAHKVAQAQQIEDQKREQFAQLRKDRLVIEKLQQRMANRQSQIQQKSEQSMLEDFVAARHGR